MKFKYINIANFDGKLLEYLGWVVNLTTHFSVVSMIRMRGSIPPKADMRPNGLYRDKKCEIPRNRGDNGQARIKFM
jgi:hypothetical protein